MVVLFPLLGAAQAPDTTFKGNGSKLTSASRPALPAAQNPHASSSEMRLQGTTPVSSIDNSRRVISYQGVLQSDGKTLPDGEYNVTIRLYVDSLAGSKLWQDTYRVQIHSGVFNIEIGSGEVPLPQSADLDRDLWLSLQVGVQDELRPLSHITATPFALNVADGAISASKISADYVRSVSVNGQTVIGNGVNVDIQTGDGITAAVDPATGAIVLKGNGASGASNNGSGIQGNTTVTGTLTVTGMSYLQGGVSISGATSFTGSSTFGSSNSDSIRFLARAGSNLNMAGYNVSNVGILTADSLKLNRALTASNGGTGFSSYSTGDLLYGNSSSSLSRLSIGASGKMLTVSNGLPVWSDVVYPPSTTANQLLFSSASNTVSGLSTASNGVLVTNGSGVPSIGSTLPSAVQDNITRLGTVTSWSSSLLPIANGGTGATTRAAAFAALAPDTTGQSGKMLTVLPGGGIVWTAANTGNGSVTSVDVSGGTTGLTASGGPITGSGTITLGGTLDEANGGTGQSSYSTGDILYASSSSTLSKLNVGVAGKVLGVTSSNLPGYIDNGATVTNNVSTPAALTANTNNYSISSSQTYIRLSSTAAGVIDLTGISASGVSAGRNVTIVNISSNPIRLKHRGASNSGNQFDLPGGEDVILGQRGSATFIYDSTAGYWEFITSN
jgi:hypothetical protein